MEAEDRPVLGTLSEAAGAAMLAYLFYLLVKAVAGAVPGVLGPAGLPLVTLSLVLIVHFLSIRRGAAAASEDPTPGGSLESIRQASRSLVGVGLLLLLLLFLLYVGASHDDS